MLRKESNLMHLRICKCRKMMHLMHLPFLEENPPVSLDLLTARDVMATPCLCLTEVPLVSEVAEVLGSSCHNGFPIIVSRDKPRVCGLVLRRQLP